MKCWVIIDDAKINKFICIDERSAGFAATAKWDERRQLAKSLADRLDSA